MPWNPEIQSINQRTQIGAEAITALGTNVAASKLLEWGNWKFGIKADVKYYAASGHKYDTVQEENREWVEGSVDGPIDYNGIPYLLASAMGSVAPVAHLASVTAKDYIYTPPTTGSIVPQTYTIEQGDAVRAHKVNYALITQLGYKITRTEVTCSAKFMSQPLQDGITLTATPTAVALAPATGKHFNIYLDPTSAGLGATQLLKVLSFEYSFDNIYGPFWPINRATVGYTSHVDLNPKATVKLKLEADANGMNPLAYLQSGVTYWLRVDGQGAVIAADGPGSINNKFTHDMAIKFDQPSEFADDAGVFALEWQANVVEDPTWGKAQTLTVTNLIAAL